MIAGGAQLVQRLYSKPQARFRAQRMAARLRGIVGPKDRQHSVADEFQHFPAGDANGVDDRRGIVVEQRDDLVGRRRVGDLRVTTQVRVPDDRVDALGDAARDAAAKHALARIAAEIHLDERSCDARQRYAFDSKREQRNESPQRSEIRLMKPVRTRRGPGRVDTVHLADDARRAEAMNESDVVGLPLSFHLAKDREVLRTARADSAAQLTASGSYQTVKWTGLPIG